MKLCLITAEGAYFSKINLNFDDVYIVCLIENDNTPQIIGEFMEITDIYSYLPKTEMSLADLEQIFNDYFVGVYDDVYAVSLEIPDNACENALMCKKELNEEGKNVAFILKDFKIVAVIGYKEW